MFNIKTSDWCLIVYCQVAYLAYYLAAFNGDYIDISEPEHAHYASYQGIWSQ